MLCPITDILLSYNPWPENPGCLAHLARIFRNKHSFPVVSNSGEIRGADVRLVVHSACVVLAARAACLGALSDCLAFAPAVSSGGYRCRRRLQVTVGHRYASSTLAEFAWQTLKQEVTRLSSA